MSDQIEIGDTVYLKSGSIAMTVVELAHDTKQECIVCEWAIRDGLQREIYPVSALTKTLDGVHPVAARMTLGNGE